ncbi:MAG: GntR family transcriptional regulator [Clostridia bacterium]
MKQQPIYIKIKNQLRDDILHMKPHDTIKSERELALELKASRMTVRKAIDLLVEEGYLYRNKNLGTFVSDRSIVKKDAVNIIMDTDYDHKVLYFTVKNADDEMSSILNVSKQEVLVRLAKSNLKNGAVNSVDDIYYVKRYFEKADIKSVSRLLDFTQMVKGGLLKQRFVPINVPVTYANILKLRVGTPIIMVESLISTPEQIPIAFIRSYNNPKEKIIEIIT